MNLTLHLMDNVTKERINPKKLPVRIVHPQWDIVSGLNKLKSILNLRGLLLIVLLECNPEITLYIVELSK